MLGAGQRRDDVLNHPIGEVGNRSTVATLRFREVAAQSPAWPERDHAMKLLVTCRNRGGSKERTWVGEADDGDDGDQRIVQAMAHDHMPGAHALVPT